jgi:hypothetical protein
MFIRYSDDTYKQYIISYPYSEDVDGNITYDFVNSQITEFVDDALVLYSSSCFPEYVGDMEANICTTNRCTTNSH